NIKATGANLAAGDLYSAGQSWGKSSVAAYETAGLGLAGIGLARMAASGFSRFFLPKDIFDDLVPRGALDDVAGSEFLDDAVRVADDSLATLPKRVYSARELLSRVD